MLNCVYTVYTLTDLTGADVVLRHAAGAAFWSSRGVDFDLGTAQSLERGARGLKLQTKWIWPLWPCIATSWRCRDVPWNDVRSSWHSSST